MVPVFLVSLKKHPMSGLSSLHGWLAFSLTLLVLAALSGPSMGAVEFPGPVQQNLLAGPLSAVSVPWSDGNTEYLLVGSDDGFLSIVYHLFGDVHFEILDRHFLDGEILWMGPWEGGPYGQRGFVVATRGPDRLHFIEMTYSSPYVRVEQTLELPEDPGVGDFLTDGPGGAAQMVLSLPGIDQVLVLRQIEGLWAINQTLNTGDEPLFLTAVDLDGDQVLEFVSADRGELSGTLGIFGQQTDGTYALESHAQLPGKVHQILSGDLDLDGLQELVVSYSDLSQLDLLTGETGNLVIHHSLNTTLPADYFQMVLLPAGNWGLVSSVEERGMMDFFLLEEESWVHQDSYYVGCRPRSLVVGDFNGDDINEVACLGYSERVLSILLGNTMPGFWGYPAVPLSNNPGPAIMSDFDGDGFTDLVVGSLVPKSLSLYPREPEGGLSRTPVLQEVGFYPLSLAAGDFLGDAANELVVLDSGANSLIFLTYAGDDGFVTHAEVPFSSGLSQLRVADIDHDGHLDLYLAQSSRQQVDVLFGLGEGVFAPVVTLDLPLGAFDVTAVDLNNDSLLELVVSDGQSRVWTMINVGGRSFGSPVHTQANAGARYLEAADLDGDADLDIVVGNSDSETITILENQGDGTLNRRIGSLSLMGQPTSVDCQDMNNDGIPDVVISLANNHGLQVLLASGTWEYPFIRLFETSGDVVNTLVEDFNQDDRPDILNLDNDLLLGLIMFNTQRVLVSVDPTALTIQCSSQEFRVRILPDRQGPWELSLGKPGQWQQLAANGHSQVGNLDFDGRAWTLNFDPAEAGFPDATMQLRLTIGLSGQEEILTLALPENCLTATESLPPLRWRDLPWPNPFNPRIHGRIQLDAASEVDAAVFDLAGRRVATLLQENLSAGVHDLTWDGQRQGRPASAGLYLLRISSNNSFLSRKIVLLK